MTGDEAFAAILRHPALPSPHGIALEIMRLVRSSDCSLPRLSKLIESDPAIAGRVLRVVNSSAFPRSRPIAAITEAVAYLGTRMVQCIALGFSLVSSEHRCRSFNYAEFWSDCLARAVGGGRTALEIPHYVPDEVFTVGLLSQIGRLALAAVFPDRYNTLLTSIRCNDSELIEAERELFDIDHNELTARLLATWGLPEVTCNAIRLQYDAGGNGFEPTDETRRLAMLLALAGRISRHILENNPESSELPEIVAHAGRLGLSPVVVVDIIRFILPQWREMLGLLDIREMTGMQLEDVYASVENLASQLQGQPPD